MWIPIGGFALGYVAIMYMRLAVPVRGFAGWARFRRS